MGSIIEQGVLIAVAIILLLIIVGVIVGIFGWFNTAYQNFTNSTIWIKTGAIFWLVPGSIMP